MKKVSESATTKTTISIREKENEDMKMVEMNINLAEESEAFEAVISFDCDMKPLYELLLLKCSKDMPTLVVLEKLPGEFMEVGYGFVSSPVDQNKIILLLEKNDSIKMQSVLSEAIGVYQNKNSLEFEKSYYPGIRLSNITHLAHNSFMYEHALNIALLLNITCPQIIMKEKRFMEENVDGFVAHLILNNVLFGSNIYLKSGGRIYQLRALAHELRHCWQKKYGNKKIVSVRANAQNSDDYFFNENEVDAEAFSCQYVKKLKGYTDIVHLLSSIGDSNKTNKYIQTIKQRMEEIKLAA